MTDPETYTYIFLKGSEPQHHELMRADYAVAMDFENNTFDIVKNRHGLNHSNVPMELMADFLKNPDGEYTIHELHMWQKS